MKKNRRVAALISELTANPRRLYRISYFCEKFGAAKSSISEDIKSASEILTESGRGRLETVPGAGGGVRFVAGITEDAAEAVLDKLCIRLSNPSRVLVGEFLYTSDIMFESHDVRDMALIFAEVFKDVEADYIVTVETKGVPLALAVSHFLNIPLVVARREAKHSEGSTISIHYFSDSNERIQRLSLSRRAVEQGKKAIIIDDFMRAGGSLKGLTEILLEFDITTVAAGVAIASRMPAKKKISEYTPLLYLDEINEFDNKKVSVSPNRELFTHNTQ